jgi:hypothetical protein
MASMDQNPYAPPRSLVVDPPAQAAAAAVPPLFAVSVLKLVVMSFFTLGLYEIWWCYKQWAAIRRHEHSDILPAARAIFGVLFCWSLFRRIEKLGIEEKVPDAPPAGFLAVAWIIVTLCWRLPDPVWIVSMAAPLFMLPMQSYANRINARLAPDHDRNARFGWANIAWIVVGGIVLALAMIGLFMPDPAGG